MGQTGSKTNFRQAVIDLTSKPSKPGDDTFWEQLWSIENLHKSSDIFMLVPTAEIRQLRDENPNNLATLCYKAIEKVRDARDNPNGFNQEKVINCVRLLTRILPYMFEEEEWRGYFWSTIPDSETQIPLASMLLGVLSDLLFCPGFTVGQVDAQATKVEDLASIDSCEYIWETGVGCATRPPSTAQMDLNRTEILKLLLTCGSEVIYMSPTDEKRLRWTMHFSAAGNKHVLPLFTSLINVVCAYDPVGMGLPYNYLLFSDCREPLVEASLQLLISCLDRDSAPKGDESGYADNYFIHFLSRIHRDEDFDFILKGITRLLQNPLQSGWMPNSQKKVAFHQELLILLWKCCEYNQKFLLHVLKTGDVLEILVPILYHICDARNDQSRIGLIHTCIFITLLLSGERNFGVRLNKPYLGKAPIDIPAMANGTHADLLIIVFHKLITTGNHRVQSLFDCLITIIVNVSPYLKTLSMTAANKLVHLVEAFSTPWFLFSSPTNHHLVFLLLEIFNNIIQYQFDGNSNLVYTIIRKRQVFYQLSNMTTDATSISKSLSGRKGRGGRTEIIDQLKSPTSPTPVTPLAPGASLEAPPAPTQTAGLAATPQISLMTDKPPTDTGSVTAVSDDWVATSEWAEAWKTKLPLQTIMRLLQVLVPQVEKICIDKGLTDESEILKFLQHGTLVGLLPVPHPILIRKYQTNAGTNHWFRTYMWGIIYLRNVDPPIWYDSKVKLFELTKHNN